MAIGVNGVVPLFEAVGARLPVVVIDHVGEGSDSLAALIDVVAPNDIPIAADPFVQVGDCLRIMSLRYFHHVLVVRLR